MAGSLKIRCLMHVPYEGPPIIADWASVKKHQLQFTRIYNKLKKKSSEKPGIFNPTSC